jgi:hypothetical protein
LFYLFKKKVRKLLWDPMRANNDGGSVKTSGRELQVNGSNVFEDGGDDKTNRYHWKSASGWPSLKIMLTGNDATSSWLIKRDVDN